MVSPPEAPNPRTIKPRRRRSPSQKAEWIIRQMETRGLALHMQHRWFGAHWFLSNGENVDTEVAALTIKDSRIVDVDSALFAGEPGQTWRYAGGDRRR
jgi:hypothetical protein